MAKRQKLLQELSGVGGVSDKSMARVMQFVQQNPLVVEGPIANQQLGRAALKILDDIGTERHTFVLKDGTELGWTYLSYKSCCRFYVGVAVGLGCYCHALCNRMLLRGARSRTMMISHQGMC